MNSIDDMAKMTNGDYSPDFIGPVSLASVSNFTWEKISRFIKPIISSATWRRSIEVAALTRNILLLM
jgi:hypothetical protein